MAIKRAKKLMMRKLIAVQAMTIILIVGLVYVPRTAEACGPSFEAAFFTYTMHPDLPLTDYAAGDLGVLQPTYARSYLAVAYRYLAGGSFDGGEQKSLAAVWDHRLKSWDPDAVDPTEVWLEARKKVPGAGSAPNIGDSRSVEGKEFYTTFLNCTADSFKTAAETLDRMIQKYGATSNEVKEWVQAQDEVFKNCSEGSSIPAAAAPSAPALVKANRAYQIASANFYAMNFDAAQKNFSDIAADSNSPWQKVAPYLVARALIRKGSLVPAENKVDEAALAQAEAQLKKILSDNSLAQLHQSANGLLSYVRMRIKPEEQLRELARAILRKTPARDLKQDLMDYTLLLDRYVNDDEDKKLATLPSVGRQDDITDWVLVYQAMDKDALDYSLKKWDQTNALPWLIASLSKIEASHPKSTSLIEAAAKVKPGSPAFATASYHSLRLMIEAGRSAEANAALTKLLAPGGAKFPPSARNLFMRLATRTARSLEEFLKYAQRVPTGVGFDEDGRELPGPPEDSDQTKFAEKNLVRFDDDATRAMNEAMPLAVLKDAAMNQSLAAHLRRHVAIAAWTKAILLDDEATARAIAPALRELAPELKADLDRYLSETAPDAKKFAALYLILKFPGTRPFVDSGLARQTPIVEIDNYRDNWWCAPGMFSPYAGTDGSEKPKPPAYPEFLTAAQKAKAKQEQDKLKALGVAPNYLSDQTVKWATVKPADPRAPEALHLAVRTTRYGCKDDETGRFSKLAFDTLHRKYPRSEWAQKTRYWYRSDQ